MIKIIICILLLGIVISLFSGLFFLVKDRNSFRTVYALGIRVTLALLLVTVVVIGVLTGELTFNSSPINAF